MREIMVRAWNKEANEMLYPREVYSFPRNWRHKMVLMQYIGLRDKRREMIWHFDILRLTGTEELYLVVWHFNRWALRDKKGKLREINKLSIEAGWFEIAGNKFENPDLLQVAAL